MNPKRVTMLICGLTSAAGVVWSLFDQAKPVLHIAHLSIGAFSVSELSLQPSTLLTIVSATIFVLIAWLWRIKTIETRGQNSNGKPYSRIERHETRSWRGEQVMKEGD